MTISETYYFLKRPRSLFFAIKRLETLHDEMLSCLLPAGVRYDTDKVQTTPEDKMLSVIARVDDISRMITEKKQERARTIDQIFVAIAKLDDEREQTVLTAFYIGGLKVRDIADIIGYSEQRTYQLRRLGVRHLSAKL